MEDEMYGQESQLEEPKKKHGVFGTIALILGIITMLTACVFGPILGLIGLVLAIIGLARKEPKKGKCIAALIITIITVIVGAGIWGGTYYAYTQVKQVLIDSGLTEEQLEVLSDMFTTEEVVQLVDVYSQYQNGEIKLEDVTLEMVGLDDREFTQEEKDALIALGQSLDIDTDSLEKQLEEIHTND